MTRSGMVSPAQTASTTTDQEGSQDPESQRSRKNSTPNKSTPTLREDGHTGKDASPVDPQHQPQQQQDRAAHRMMGSARPQNQLRPSRSTEMRNT